MLNEISIATCCDGDVEGAADVTADAEGDTDVTVDDEAGLGGDLLYCV